jgi:hypothetical protein
VEGVNINSLTYFSQDNIVNSKHFENLLEIVEILKNICQYGDLFESSVNTKFSLISTIIFKSLS